MAVFLFNPFEQMRFGTNICFLTGNKLSGEEQKTIPVFPTWMVERYNLEEATLAMHSGYRIKYKDMTMPASKDTIKAVHALDELTQRAFESGYEAVKQLPGIVMFQWLARVMYGVMYQEIVFNIQHSKEKGHGFNLSEFMQTRLKNMLFMLQSLVRPVVFEGFEPWTIKCFKVNVSKDILNYKDETKKQNFCLGMNGFGILACLQDNGAIGQYYQQILDQIGDNTLHPAQFEELYGRFMYANYLLRDMPEYELSNDRGTIIFRLPEDPRPDLPQFAEWQDNIYAQVLTNMLEPWGIPIQQIYRFPDPPVSYLINEMTQELIPAEEINLDY